MNKLKNIFGKTKNRVLAGILTTAIVVGVISGGLSGTLAAGEPVNARDFLQPNSYTVINKDATAIAVGSGGATSAINSDDTILTVTQPGADGKPTVAGKKAGVASVTVFSRLGVGAAYNYQVVDPNGPSGYSITKEITDEDNVANVNDIVTIKLNGSATMAIADKKAKIQWWPMDSAIAGVSVSGDISKGTRDGATTLLGRITDKYGVEQIISVPVTVGKTGGISVLPGKDPDTFWLPMEKPANIYAKSTEDGKITFPTEYLYAPNGPDKTPSRPAYMGDDGKFYVEDLPTNPGIWKPLDHDGNILDAPAIWTGGPGTHPGQGNDIEVQDYDGDYYYKDKDGKWYRIRRPQGTATPGTPPGVTPDGVEPGPNSKHYKLVGNPAKVWQEVNSETGAAIPGGTLIYDPLGNMPATSTTGMFITPDVKKSGSDYYYRDTDGKWYKINSDGSKGDPENNLGDGEIEWDTENPANNKGKTFTADGIVWKVIHVDSATGNMAIVSRDILEQKAYDAASPWSPDYVGSNLESIMNTYNASKLPTLWQYVQPVVLPVDTHTPAASYFSSVNSSGTKKAFALSKKEAETWFANDAARKATGGANWYWLRSPYGGSNAWGVDSVGTLTYYGDVFPVGNVLGGVRPAFWIKVFDVAPPPLGGDTVEWDYANVDNNVGKTFTVDSIVWKVIRVNRVTGDMFIVSRDILEQTKYHGSSSVYIGSDLETKMKTYNATKLPTLWKYVQPVSFVADTTGNSYFSAVDKAYGNKKAFALSKAEATNWFANDNARAASGTGTFYYWLRSPYASDIAWYVFTDGSIYDGHIDYVAVTSTAGGVRPAFWINLNA